MFLLSFLFAVSIIAITIRLTIETLFFLHRLSRCSFVWPIDEKTIVVQEEEEEENDPNKRKIRPSSSVMVTEKWALITGAGTGVGYEFARHLAHKGYHLLLISLHDDELNEAKRRIIDEMQQTSSSSNINRASSTIRIETFAIDFDDDGEDDGGSSLHKRIEQFLRPFNGKIHVLVNNVGTLPRNRIDRFLDSSRRDNERMINVNIRSVITMCELVLPTMLKQQQKQQKQRGNGSSNCLVINIASGAAYQNSPYMATYAATKAFVLKLSECLVEEYQHTNVSIICLCPYWLSTNLSLNPPPNILVPTAQTYVRSAFASIIRHNGESFCSTGYLPHDAIYWSTMAIGWIGGANIQHRYMHWLMVNVKKLQLRLESLRRGSSGSGSGIIKNE